MHENYTIKKDYHRSNEAMKTMTDHRYNSTTSTQEYILVVNQDGCGLIDQYTDVFNRDEATL